MLARGVAAKNTMATITETAIFVGRETQVIEIELLSLEGKKNSEDAEGEGVKDTVEDLLRVHVDGIGALRDGPSDGVQHHHADLPSSEHGEGAVSELLNAGDVSLPVSEELPADEGMDEDSDAEESPLVAGFSEGTSEVKSSPDHGEEDREPDTRPVDGGEVLEREDGE